MPNSTSAVLSPIASAMADGRKASRSITPSAEQAYSSRACNGVMSRSERPTTLQSRAAYSSAKAMTAETSIAVNSHQNRASISGTDARIAASTSTVMIAMTSRTNRAPTEYGRWSCSSSS